jgi:hypothetical protein
VPYTRAYPAWHDLPDLTTPITAAKLQGIEDGIVANDSRLTGLFVNVKDYGAVGDGTTDDYAAIMAAYAALPAAGGTLYFPAGRYRFNTALAFVGSSSKQLSLLGAGAASVLVPGFSSGDAVTFTGPVSRTRVSIANLHIEPAVARDQTAYNLSLVSTVNATVTGVTMENSLGGGLYQFNDCVFLKVSNCQGRSSSSAAGVALRIIACNGSPQFSNSRFETANGATGYTGYKPALHVTGTCTGLKFTGCTFTGAGPHSQFTVTGVTSTGAAFTVTTSATHDFRVGDFAVLRGMTPAPYNSMWRVATVPTGTTFTVTSALNPGTSSVNGTAESVAACALVTNEDAGSTLSVNESAFTGCLFEASLNGLYGSVSLYFDGRRGNYPVGAQSGQMSGWTLAGNYYDQYAIGLLISGMASNAANEPTACGFSISGGLSAARGRTIHLDQVQGVTLGDPVVSNPGAITPIDDGISVSCSLYIYSGPAAPFTQGINVTGGQFGMCRNWQAVNNTPFKYGMILDGAGIDDLVAAGNTFFGSTLAIGMLNGALTDGRRWKIHANECAAVTFPPTAATLIPTVASAASVALPVGYDTVKISGSTSIQTVTGSYVGREVTLIFTGAVSFVPGGNLAITTPRSVTTGAQLTLIFDGTSWYLSTPTVDRTQLAQTAAGVITENGPPYLFTTGLAPATQAIAGSLVGLRGGDVVTGIKLSNSVAAAGTLPTTVRFGLADITGKILVLSGNLNSLASWVQGPIPFPFTAPYTVLADGGYYAVFVVNGVWGTTQPTPARTLLAQWYANPFNAKAPLVIAQAAQTDLPAIGSSIPVVASTNVLYYMGVY